MSDQPPLAGYLLGIEPSAATATRRALRLCYETLHETLRDTFKMRPLCETSMSKNLWFNFRRPHSLVLALGLSACAVSHARYVTTEGKGYTMCERIAAHVNRLTDNGRAPKFWTFLDVNRSPKLRYPDSQSYLTRELFSYPGFKRPAFTEIELEYVRGVIELMGEVDTLDGGSGERFGYNNNDESIKRYLEDRKAGKVPEEMLAPITRANGLYKSFEKGQARVFTLRDETLSDNTIMQIEFKSWSGEPVSTLRVVTNDLTEPLKRADLGLDSASLGNALVEANGTYYTLYGGARGFEVQSRSPTANPYLCRIGQRPSLPIDIK